MNASGGYSGNPFAFKANEEKMQVKNAPNYIPPHKRKYIKDYLSNSSINLTNVSDKDQLR